MFWYISLAVMPSILFFLIPRKLIFRNNNSWRKIYVALCGLFLFLMIALRHYSVGSTDSLNYYNNWGMLRDSSFSQMWAMAEQSKMETGYLFTVWILSRVFYWQQFVFIFSGLLFTVAVCRFLYKNCDNLLIGFTMFICLGLYTFIVQGLRQTVAMSICLFSIEFCKRRNFKCFLAFVLLIILAMQYHQTAIVFFPIYFLYGKKLNSIWTLAILFGYAIILYFSGYIIDVANDIFDRNYHRAIDGGGFVAVAIYLIVLAVGVLSSSREDKENKNFSFFIHLTIIGTVIFLMRYVGTLAAERISFYFMFGQLVILPNTVQRFESKTKKILIFLIIMLSVALFAYRLSSSDLIPYLFYWQGA